MTYSTGSFGGSDGYDVIHTKLKAFALADSWTIDEGTFPNLQLHKGTTFVNLTFKTSDLVDDTLNTGASVPDYRIYGYLSDAYPPGTYPNHALNNTDAAMANDFLGPYSKFWFFSGGDSDPHYIHMVVQKANGRFCCLMFGQVDKKGVTYTGGDYITGVFWNWWFVHNAAVSPGNNSTQGSDPFGAHGFPGDFNESYNVRLGDACVAHPFTSNFFTSRADYSAGLNPLLRRQGSPQKLEDVGVTGTRWVGQNYWLGPNPVNGVTPLHEIMYQFYDTYSANNRLIALGVLPDYRGLSMLSRSEVETVTFGSDNWLVFPIKRNLPFLPEPFATRTITSGPYGHAFKIIM